MSSAGAAPRIVRFGLYESDLAAGGLRKNGVKIKLQERPFQILTILLEVPGQVVTRETFQKRLWPADTFVDFDHSRNTSIKKLGDALCDDAENPRFIATVGRRGYRLIAPVDESGAAKPEPASAVVASEADSYVALIGYAEPRSAILLFRQLSRFFLGRMSRT